MLEVFVSKRDADQGKAFVIIIDEQADDPQTAYYYSPAQIDELCERLQQAKLQALHFGPVKYR